MTAWALAPATVLVLGGIATLVAGLLRTRRRGGGWAASILFGLLYAIGFGVVPAVP